MSTLIAIPCGDSCPTDFLRSLLSLEIVGAAQFTFAQGSLVYDARNKLCGIAMDGGFDRVLWLDSDMVFQPDLMRRLSAHLDKGLEMVCGAYSTRKPPLQPVVYEDFGLRQAEPWPEPYIEPFQLPLPDELFKVAGCGFGAVMMTVDLIRRVHEQFGLPFSPAAGFGEDLSFCLRAREAGAQIWCDPEIELGHIGVGCYRLNNE